MSKDWEVVQEKAFLSWVNGVLSHLDEKVADITTDFSDGVKLIHFLELLSSKKIGKKIELDPKSRIHKIQNLHLALQFTETLDVQAQGVGAEDFVDSNKKLILGFLWTLYRKYRIAVIKEGDKSSEEGLLLWCKNTTNGYTGVDIKNFKTGFRDGAAYLALAHKFDPSFNFDDFTNESPEVRLEKAFDLAEKNMNIPKLLDISEVMKGTADERAMILYTSLFFHAFGAKAQKEALDASRRDAASESDALKQRLDSEKASREQLLESNKQLEADKSNLQSALDAKTKEAAELAAQVAELKQRVADLEDRLSSAEKSRDDFNSQLQTSASKLDAQSKRADTEFSALIHLRQQFDQHCVDMHRWRKLVEVDVGDFHTEVKVPLIEQLAKEGSFDKQLTLLSGKLTDETKDIQGYLQEKEEFAKQKMKTQKPPVK